MAQMFVPFSEKLNFKQIYHFGSLILRLFIELDYVSQTPLSQVSGQKHHLTTAYSF